MRFTCASSVASLGLIVGVLAFAAERDASACGGCFAPIETNTVVTDHRMILSISPHATTLYDQIRYQGEPASFAWVLPITGSATVGLGSDVVFQSLDAQTATRIQAPPRNCPQPQCNSKGTPPGVALAASAGAEDANGVIVTKQEVVGPYETVQLHSTDPQALSKWLSGHGYNIPEDIKPIIGAYVSDGFDFLALKLVPGASVRAMQPVRVTTPGAAPVLPLRMVAAGTGAQVGVTLWVVAEGRWEPQNFPSFHIAASDLAWDWNQNASTMTAVREKKNEDLGGSAWEIESSIALSTTYLRNASTGYPVSPPNVDGGAQSTYDQSADMDALLGFATSGQVRVTRLRSDLGRASLAQDLQLTATPDQSELSNVRVLTNEVNEPICPVYSGCEQVGTAPRSVAQARSSSGGCSMSMRAVPGAAGWGGASIALALAALSQRRRRKLSASDPRGGSSS